jgi:hypothetical protein
VAGITAGGVVPRCMPVKLDVTNGNQKVRKALGHEGIRFPVPGPLILPFLPVRRGLAIEATWRCRLGGIAGVIAETLSLSRMRQTPRRLYISQEARRVFSSCGATVACRDNSTGHP